MDEWNKKRCISISNNIRDKLNAIQSELVSNYQSPKYLLEKIEPILWDANVLKSIFEEQEKLDTVKGENNGDNM